MWLLALFAVVAVASAQDSPSALPPKLDARCTIMNKEQWEEFGNREALRELVFADLGISTDQAYVDVIFDGTENGLDPSYFCAEGWNTVFEPAYELRCNQITVNAVDQSYNAPGSVGVNIQSGTQALTTITDTDSFQIGAGASMTMTGTIPLIGSTTATVQISGSYTKQLGTSKTYQTNTLSWIQRVVTVEPENSDCTVDITVVACQHETRGKYPIVALGWIGWRLKDEITVNGKKARRWYVFIDSLPREVRLGWGKIHAGITSQTYSTVFSHCSISSSTKTRRNARMPRRLHDRDGSVKLEPLTTNKPESVEGKLLRAKEAVPDHLRDKVMRVGNTIILPVEDID